MRRRSQPGAPPGTITADPQAYDTAIDIFGYGPDGFIEEKEIKPSRIREVIGKWPMTWVNVEGMGNVDCLREIAGLFEIHPLMLEDIVNVHQRAKVEVYGNQLFVVVRMTRLGDDKELASEQLAVVVGENFVLTFQEIPGDVLGPVRDRIRSGRGAVRREKSDALAYALIDAVVDHYFPVLEHFGEMLEDVEEQVMTRADEAVLKRIHRIKRDLLMLRRCVWPHREALAALHREELPNIRETTRVYLRDTYDHSIQVMDLLETYREMAASLLEVYLSQASNRLNEVMKVLTIFSSIFIPLTFITGLYGMNFDTEISPYNMPELEWRFGYFYSIALMVAVTAGTVAYFAHKGWMFSRQARAERREARREARLASRGHDGSP